MTPNRSKFTEQLYTREDSAPIHEPSQTLQDRLPGWLMALGLASVIVALCFAAGLVADWVNK